MLFAGKTEKKLKIIIEENEEKKVFVCLLHPTNNKKEDSQVFYWGMGGQISLALVDLFGAKNLL